MRSRDMTVKFEAKLRRDARGEFPKAWQAIEDVSGWSMAMLVAEECLETGSEIAYVTTKANQGYPDVVISCGGEESISIAGEKTLKTLIENNLVGSERDGRRPLTGEMLGLMEFAMELAGIMSVALKLREL